MPYGDFTQVFGGLYELGHGNNVAFPAGGFFISDFVNARDLGSTGQPDFAIVGPGSQVWRVAYAINLVPSAPPVDTLGVELHLVATLDTGPFIFFNVEQTVLPVYQTGVRHPYSGDVRIEWPAVRFEVFNVTGVDLTVTFQFWAKAF